MIFEKMVSFLGIIGFEIHISDSDKVYIDKFVKSTGA
jgi:hypothetical protein